MTGELTTFQKLTRQFALSEHANVKKGGAEQTYAPWTEYVERLNNDLEMGWSFRVVREGFTATECWVLGEITATIDGVETVRQQYGCEPIALGQSANGDLLKKAASDAVKKAASMLGIGLYLSIKEERLAVQAAMRAEVQAEVQRQADERAGRNKPKSIPISKARFDLEKAYRDGMTFADSIGLTPEDLDVVTLDDAALREVTDALRDQCRYVLAEKKKAAGTA